MRTEWTRIEEYIHSLKPSKNANMEELFKEIDRMFNWYIEHYNLGGTWYWSFFTNMADDEIIIVIDHTPERSLPQQRKYTIHLT